MRKNNRHSRWLKIIQKISKRTFVINQEQLKLDLVVCATLTSGESRRASNGLNKSCPSQTILIKWTRCSSCLSLSSRFQFPVSQQNCIPAGTRGHLPHPLTAIKPAPHSLSLFTIVPNTTPVWP